MVLLPMAWMLFSNERWKPLISATMPITVPTPITIPSNASNERRRLENSAPPAILKLSRSKNRFIALLVAKRLDGIEPGGAPGRIRAEEHADHARHQDAQHHGRHAHRRRQRADGPH